MKIRQSAVFVLFFGLVAGSAQSAIYQSVDRQGNVTFSDEPGANAKPVKLPPLPIYTAPEYVQPISDSTDPDPDQEKQSPYKSLNIIQPEQEGTVRDNPGNVLVIVAPDPQLRSGDKIQFYLDGAPVDAPVSTSQTVFTNVPRGEHQVQAAVVDNSGQELVRSSSVKFFLHRQNLNSPPRKPVPAPRN